MKKAFTSQFQRSQNFGSTTIVGILVMLLSATALCAQSSHVSPAVPGTSQAPVGPGASATADKISAAIIVEQFRALGYTASTDLDESGDPRVNTAVDGHNWQIYFYDCDKDGVLEQRRCDSFQFFADNRMPKPVPPATINRWNKEYRYAKAYLQQGDDAGCAQQGGCAARIETDVLMNGTGADPASAFRGYFEIFKRRAQGFREFIGAD